jgi:hypothetical protein
VPVAITDGSATKWSRPPWPFAVALAIQVGTTQPEGEAGPGSAGPGGLLKAGWSASLPVSAPAPAHGAASTPGQKCARWHLQLNVPLASRTSPAASMLLQPVEEPLRVSGCSEFH